MRSSPQRPDGAELELTWNVLSNTLADDRCLLELSLSNRGHQPLVGQGWAIYFNGVNRPDPKSSTGGARVEVVNGDVYRLVPTAEFGNLEPGQTRRIRYVASGWAIQRTDCPRGAYIVYADGTPDARAASLGDPILLPLERPEQLVRGVRDRVATRGPAEAYQDNQQLSLLPLEQVGLITPTPRLFEPTGGVFRLEVGCGIWHPLELEREARALRAALRDLMGFELPLSLTPLQRGIELRLEPQSRVSDEPTSIEAYRLEVTSGGISIAAGFASGVFRAIQSLRQLTPSTVWLEPSPSLPIPCCRVEDAPRFAYRGLLLDVARNFSAKAAVFRLLDTMALYKLSKLHLHLTDDEGWRVAIAALPELTEYGARRSFSVGEQLCLPPSFGSGPDEHSVGSGYYSRADLVEIVRYAADRHIQVIPEIDVPGHARAAIKSMELRYRRLVAADRKAEAEAYLLTDFDDPSSYRSEQGWRDNVICIGRESCYRFMETVVRELKEAFDEAGSPLETLHVGGDEMPAHCWEESPCCKSFMREHRLADLQALRDYFYERLSAILRKYSVTLAGWEEIALVRATAADTSVTPNPKFVAAKFVPYVWNTAITSSETALAREDAAFRLANLGYDVVLCSVANLYLDFAYEKHPAEPGYYWGGFINARKVFEHCASDPLLGVKENLFGEPLPSALSTRLERLEPEAQRRILGIQGQLWGENIRSEAELQYLLLPRLLPLAERAWARDPGWDALPAPERPQRMLLDWNEFANRLGQRELPRLDGFLGGLSYRIPVPGATIVDGMLQANVCLPGFVLRYSTDGTVPTAASPAFAPLRTEQATIAAFSTTGRRGRCVTVRASTSDCAMPARARGHS